MPWGLSPAHLIILLVIILIVVGPGKLPETGAAIGKALRGFKDAIESGDSHQAPPPVQPVAPPAYPAQYPPQPPQYPPQQPQYPAQQPYAQTPHQEPVPAQPYAPPTVQPAPLLPTEQPVAPQGEPPRQG